MIMSILLVGMLVELIWITVLIICWGSVGFCAWLLLSIVVDTMLGGPCIEDRLKFAYRHTWRSRRLGFIRAFVDAKEII